MAGLFFIFSNTVMAALARLPAEQGLAAMQSINAVILNPLFLGVFFGAALASLAVIVVAGMQWQQPGSALATGGAVAYLFGAVLVTMVRNVPLNSTLATISPTGADSARAWNDYVRRWTAWNHVRAVACLLAAGAHTLALPGANG